MLEGADWVWKSWGEQVFIEPKLVLMKFNVK